MSSKVRNILLTFLVAAQLAPTSLSDAPNYAQKSALALEQMEVSELLEAVQAIEQLMVYGQDTLPEQLKNLYGGIFSPSNLKNDRNREVLNGLTRHLEILRLQGVNVKRLLKKAEAEGVQVLLPDELAKEYKEAREKILTTTQSQVITTDAFSYITVLHYVMPYLGELLELDETLTSERLLGFYYKVVSVQARVQLLQHSLEQETSKWLRALVSSEELSELQQRIREYQAKALINSERLKSLAQADSMDALKELVKKHSDARMRYWLNEFEALEKQTETVLAELKEKEVWVKNSLKHAVQQAEDQVNQAALAIKKEVDAFEIPSGEYVDIFPESQTASTAPYWLRVHLPDGTFSQLDRQKDSVTGLSTRMAVVFRVPLQEGTHARMSGSNFISEVRMNTEQVSALTESLQELTTEVPLGLQVQQVSLAQKATSLPLRFEAHSPDTSLRFNRVSLSFPNSSPWTQYKNVLAEQQLFLQRVGVSAKLGVEVKRILLTKNLDVQLHLQMKPGGLLDELLHLNPQKREFSILLSEIHRYRASMGKALRQHLARKAATALDGFLREQHTQPAFRKMLVAQNVDSTRVDYQDDRIRGVIYYQPVGFSAFGEDFEPHAPSRLVFETSIENGRCKVHWSSPVLSYEKAVRSYLQKRIQRPGERCMDSLRGALQESEMGQLAFNLAQKLACSGFQANFENRRIEGTLWLKEKPDIKATVLITPGTITVRHLDELILSALQNRVEGWVKSQFDERLNQLCAQLHKDDVVELFNVPFRVRSEPQCTHDRQLSVVVEYADAPSNVIYLKADDHGSLTIESFRAPILKEKAGEVLRSVLDIKSPYVRLGDPTFSDGRLAFSVITDLEVLGMSTELGTANIDLKGRVHFNGTSGTQAIKTAVDQKFRSVLSGLIENQKLALQFTDEGDGLEIYALDHAQTSLFGPAQIVVKGRARLANLIEIDNFTIKLNLRSKDLLRSVEVTAPDLSSILASPLKQKLKAMVVPGLEAEIDLDPVHTDPIALTGRINLTLNGLTFPDMLFEVTQHQVRFHPTLSFPLRMALQIVPPTPTPPNPGLVVFGGNVTLDLKQQLIGFAVNMTIGEVNTASTNAQLINFRSKLSSYYEAARFGDLEINANLFLLTLFNVFEGHGLIKTKEGCFSMQTQTKGALRDVFKFDRDVVLNCDQTLFRNDMTLKTLGVEFKTEMQARRVTRHSVRVDGRTEFEFLSMGHLRGAVGTLLEPDVTSLARNAKAEFEGSLKISKFKLSSAHLDLDYYYAAFDFSVLGASIGMSVPNVGSFSEGMILDKILSLLNFDPEVLLEILKHPEKISFKVAPMGGGGSGSNGSGNGGGGGASGGGNNGKEDDPQGGRKGDGTNQNENKASSEQGKENTPPGAKTYHSPFKGNTSFEWVRFAGPGQKRKDRAHEQTKDRFFPDQNLQACFRINPPQWSPYYLYLHGSVADQLEKHVPLRYPFAGRVNLSWVDTNTTGFFGSYRPSNDWYNAGLQINWQLTLAPDGKLFLSMYTYLPSLSYDRYSEQYHEEEKDRINYVRIQGQSVNFGIEKKGWGYLKPNRNSTTHVAWCHLIEKPENVYRRIGDDFLSLKGKRMKHRKRILRRIDEEIPSDSAQLIIFREGDNDALMVYGLHPAPSISYYYDLPKDKCQLMNDEKLSVMKNFLIEIPERVCHNIFASEPWYDSGRSITENLKAFDQTQDHWLLHETQYELGFTVRRYIEHPLEEPNYRKLTLPDRKLLLWNADAPEDILLQDRRTGAEWSFTDNDLHRTLGLFQQPHATVFDKLNSNQFSNLQVQTFLSFSDRKIQAETDRLICIMKDTFVFMDSQFGLKVQTKDSLWKLPAQLNLRKFEPLIQGDGDAFNLPQYVKTHKDFFESLIRLLVQDSTVQVQLEEEEGRIIAYCMNEKHFFMFWETVGGGMTRTPKTRRSTLHNNLKRAGYRPTGIRYLSSVSPDADLSEIVTFLRKGFTTTSKWYGKDEDFLHPLFILNE